MKQSVEVIFTAGNGLDIQKFAAMLALELQKGATNESIQKQRKTVKGDQIIIT